jgi:phosphoribosylformylglycinamidine cyclo-ligase
VKYKEAGVDISRAEDALARIRDKVRATKRPEVIGDIGAFGGLFRLTGTDTVLVATTDGVGTKLEIARLLDRHEVVGTDLVHHCVNDAMAMGAEPLFSSTTSRRRASIPPSSRAWSARWRTPARRTAAR